MTSARTEVAFGEPVDLVVKATGPAGTTFSFPGEAASEAFELRPLLASAEAAAAPEPGTQRYRLAVFATGEVTFPAIPVRYRLPDGTQGETASEPLKLQVASLLPREAEEQKLADIRGPQPVAIGRAFWIALGTGLVLAAALVVWLVRRRRRREQPEPTPLPATAPDVEARHALDELAASGLVAEGEFRRFYIRLTMVAKRYLERRLDAPVLEMTSAETLAFLRGNRHGDGVLGVVRDLAGAADQIKFARGTGLAQEAERHLAAVRGLVDGLEDRLRPAPAEPEGRAA